MFGRRRIERDGEMRDDERRRSVAERIARFVPTYVAVLVTLIGLAVLVNVRGDTTQGRQIDTLLRKQQAQNYHATYSTQRALNRSCDRGNAERRRRVDVILDTARGNRARARAWGSLDPSLLPPPIVRFARHQQLANAAEARRLRFDANGIADSQIEVSVHPHAADARRRSVVDCDAVYPVPDHYGDPIPGPTKP